MKSNKVIALITSLSEKERSEIHEALLTNSHSKKSLELFEIINNHNPEKLSKKLIFNKLYKTSYSKDKDYLLRSSYRNLLKKIEEFLIEETFHKEIRKNLNVHNYYLLKSIQHLRLYHLFDMDYKSMLHKAAASNDYIYASSITGLQVNNYLHHLIPSTKNYERADHTLSLQMAYLSAFYLNAIQKSSIDKAYIRNSLAPLSKKQEKKNDKAYKKAESGNLYGKYLKLKIKIFDHDDSDNINILKECLSLLDQLTGNVPEIAQEYIFCRSALAHEYSLLEDYKQANELNEKLLKKIKQLDHKHLSSIIFNYVSNLIRLELFDTALAKIKQYEKHFENATPALLLKLSFLKLMLYAFTNDAKSLNGHIPACNDLIDYQKYICRLLYSINFYLNDDYAHAHRECINLKNALRYKAPDFDIRDILNFYIRFYYLLDKNSDNARNGLKFMERLEQGMNNYAQHAQPEFREYLPFIWLRREVKLRLKPTKSKKDH